MEVVPYPRRRGLYAVVHPASGTVLTGATPLTKTAAVRFAREVASHPAMIRGGARAAVRGGKLTYADRMADAMARGEANKKMTPFQKAQQEREAYLASDRQRSYDTRQMQDARAKAVASTAAEVAATGARQAAEAQERGPGGTAAQAANAVASFTSGATNKGIPPNVADLLRQVGDERITSLYAARAPVAGALEGALSLLSAGTWSGAKSAGGFDKIYHLRLIINGKYTLEKVERVSFTRGVGEKSETFKIALDTRVYNDASKTAYRTVPLNVSIAEFYRNGAAAMGERFYTYDAFTNNCQAFVATLLSANGLLTPEARAWIVQDAETLLKNTPAYLSGIARTLTNLGNISNAALQGGGGGGDDAPTSVGGPRSMDKDASYSALPAPMRHHGEPTNIRSLIQR